MYRGSSGVSIWWTVQSDENWVTSVVCTALYSFIYHRIFKVHSTASKLVFMEGFVSPRRRIVKLQMARPANRDVNMPCVCCHPKFCTLSSAA